MILADAVTLAATGLIAGGLNALAGGGTLIVFPALVFTGLNTLSANVTNSLALWPSYVGGTLGFRPELVGHWQQLARLGAVAAAGSLVGCLLLLATPTDAFDVIAPFLVLLASLLLAIQPHVSHLLQTTTVARRPSGSVYPLVFLAAIYGGYFGGAVGIILLAVLTLTLAKDRLLTTNALRTVLSLVISSMTVVIFGIFGPVRWSAVAIVAPMSILGAFIGVRVARRLDEQVLRRSVVSVGIAAAVYLFVRALA